MKKKLFSEAYESILDGFKMQVYFRSVLNVHFE